MNKFKVGDILVFIPNHNTISNSIIQEGDKVTVLSINKDTESDESIYTVQLESDRIISISENYFKALVRNRYGIAELKEGNILNIITTDIYNYLPFAIDISDLRCKIVQSKLDWEIFLRTMN